MQEDFGEASSETSCFSRSIRGWCRHEIIMGIQSGTPTMKSVFSDETQCAWCLEEKTGLTKDHVVPRSIGGTLEYALPSCLPVEEAPRKLICHLPRRSSEDMPMTEWFARPVLHATDVEASLRFYVNRLGFTSPWGMRRTAERTPHRQVERQGCALILADAWPDKIGKELMFISLNVEQGTHEAAIAALDAVRAELEAREVLRLGPHRQLDLDDLCRPISSI
jgi:hypothetical protein